MQAPLAVLAGLFAAGSAQDPLVVHEWGTFTSLQDEEGRCLGGINSDDEPVPDFVMDPRSLGLPHRPEREPQPYEDFLRRSLAKFSEYQRPEASS